MDGNVQVVLLSHLMFVLKYAAMEKISAQKLVTMEIPSAVMDALQHAN